MNASKSQYAFFAVLTSATVAGFAGWFIRNMSINPISQTWLRMVTPLVLASAAMLVTQTPFFSGNWRKMIGISALSMLRVLLFFVGMNYTSISKAIILFYTFPIFVAIFGAIILKEIITNRQKWLLAFAFLGLLLTFGGDTNLLLLTDNQDVIGMLAATGGAMVYAIAVVYYKSETGQRSLQEMLFYQNLMGGILLLPFFEFAKATLGDVALGVSYGVTIGYLSFFLFFYGLKYMKASTASALMYLEIVSAIFISYFLLDEPINIFSIVGGTMIIISSFMLK